MARAFIIGSSLPASLLSLAYIGVAFARASRPVEVPFETIAIVVPLAYGLANVVNVHFGNTVESAAITGLVLGLLFSVVGRFLLHLPQKIFQFGEDNIHIVHIIAPALYSLIFLLLIRPLNHLFDSRP